MLVVIGTFFGSVRRKNRGPRARDIGDAVEFARARLGFEADVGGEAGDSELLAAVGEIDGGGCDGGVPGVYAAGESGAAGESVGTAKPGVFAESGGVCGAAGDSAARGRLQMLFPTVAAGDAISG